MLKRILLFAVALSAISVHSAWSTKPAVWIISDGCDKSLRHEDAPDKYITDPDDISAIASYLLMSNNFDTKGIVIGSNNAISTLSNVPDQAQWAQEYFGAAYKSDLEALNREIAGYQDDIPFYNSVLVKDGSTFNPSCSYDSLADYPSIAALFEVVEMSDDVVNIFCWGRMTEQAIFVKHCKSQCRYDLLRRVRFISHWTASYLRVGTEAHPERVHNCFNDAAACAYLKNEALNGTISFYECGSIGQTGIVEGGYQGREFYDQFLSSELGRIYVEGKYVENKGWVDNSDAATFWALLGNWGVSLDDLQSNGKLTAESELKNQQSLFESAKSMQEELLRRSRVAAGAISDPINIDNLFPSHGLTDPHVWAEGGRIYLFGGHDESWETDNTWKMNRWEIWSSDNLRDWRFEDNILPTDTYIGDNPNCWAGDIVGRDGKFYWYFSNRNDNTGVMVSDRIDGGYRDALGKPLLPKGIISGHPYDPEIFVEGDKYYIIFASGKYYISELGKDMISLAHEPRQIVVKNSEGAIVTTQDKSCSFYRDGIYYLVWGSNYATSDNIYGPYLYRGKFLAGGHSSVFEWNGQWYVVQENKDISLFYRGVSLKPIFFDKDGLVVVPHDDIDYPGSSRLYDFGVSQMGWRATSGEPLVWNAKLGSISGALSSEATTIQSAMWLLTDCSKLSQVTVTLNNHSNASQARVSVASYTPQKGLKFWEQTDIVWDEQWSRTFELEDASKEFVEYTIELDPSDLNAFLKAVRIEPAVGQSVGRWEVSNIEIR